MAVETITTVLVPACAESPASPYDLTDLPTVKDELSIPDDDTSKDSFLSRAITQASAAIASYCNRVFAVEALQDQLYIQRDPYPYQVPGGIYPLQLSRWPVASSAVVSVTGNTHGSIVVDGVASTAGIQPGALVFSSDGSIPAGTKVKSVAPQSLILTQAATTSVTGLSITTGVQVVQQLAVGMTQTLVYGQDFKIDANLGWLIRINSFTGISQKWEADPTTVTYQAGYSSIPADLVDACLRLVTARFLARGRDPMLMERSQPNLGTDRFWIGNTPGQVGSLPPEIQALVDHYRVPVIA